MNKYRFTTKNVEDYRPLIFNPKYPWWCSGISGDNTYAIIICYLPKEEDLFKYWDDAKNIEITEDVEIEFNSRFPKPNWFVKS